MGLTLASTVGGAARTSSSTWSILWLLRKRRLSSCVCHSPSRLTKRVGRMSGAVEQGDEADER